MLQRQHGMLDRAMAQAAGRSWHGSSCRRTAGSRPGQREEQQEREEDDTPARQAERMVTQDECSSAGLGPSVRVDVV
jgi:hypothetical protein